jgi:hypothetical protein
VFQTVQARCLVAIAIACLAGCPTPDNTRFPTLAPRPPAIERQSYQRHDPYPNENLGPETFTRPREFREQREEPRRVREGQPLPGVFVPETIGPPATGAQYRDAVPN